MKFSGNVDNGPGKWRFNFGEYSGWWRNFTFDLPMIQPRGFYLRASIKCYVTNMYILQKSKKGENVRKCLKGLHFHRAVLLVITRAWALILVQEPFFQVCPKLQLVLPRVLISIGEQTSQKKIFYSKRMKMCTVIGVRKNFPAPLL